MDSSLTTIGFDADDTLWQNETFFKLTQDRFEELLSEYADPRDLDRRLREAEVRNIQAYGYGVKGFTLSMIETAIEVTDERVPVRIIRALVDMGRDMLDHPMELLPGAEDAVVALKSDFRLVLITKGDLLHQEKKLAQSGLGDHFDGVEIVSEKTPATYVDAFARHGSGARSAMMVGNSMKSDVIPALQAGSWGVHVPHELEWDMERADAPEDHHRFHQIETLGALSGLVRSLSNG